MFSFLTILLFKEYNITTQYIQHLQAANG